MYYGLYKDIRNSAWKCLLDFNIDALPVDVLKIARSANIRVIKDSVVNDLSPNENGKSYFDGESWTIIYNDKNPTELSRYTIAHELGHIFLGHEMKYAKYAGATEIKSKPKSEQQADAFAQRLLCPACVIWGLELKTSQEIEERCMIEPEVAEKRAKRMAELYKRNKFLTDKNEQELYLRFEKYILDTKS